MADTVIRSGAPAGARSRSSPSAARALLEIAAGEAVTKPSAAGRLKNKSHPKEKYLSRLSTATQFHTTAAAEEEMAEQTFSPPTWKTQRESSDNAVTITPCEPIEMRLMDVRIPWEPSSFV